jgi:hypothetical protein
MAPKATNDLKQNECCLIGTNRFTTPENGEVTCKVCGTVQQECSNVTRDVDTEIRGNSPANTIQYEPLGTDLVKATSRLLGKQYRKTQLEIGSDSRTGRQVLLANAAVSPGTKTYLESALHADNLATFGIITDRALELLSRHLEKLPGFNKNSSEGQAFAEDAARTLKSLMPSFVQRILFLPRDRAVKELERMDQDSVLLQLVRRSVKAARDRRYRRLTQVELPNGQLSR